MNNKIEQLHHQLVELLNTCGLPIGVAYYVYKDVLNNLDNLYLDALKNEFQEEQQNSQANIEQSKEE